MAQLKLSARLFALVGVVLLAGGGGAAWLLWTLNATSATYDRLLKDDEVQHQDRARVMQVTFKTQVQEWKNVLLRGSDPKQLAKYRDGFTKSEKEVATVAAELRSVVKDAEALQTIDGFIAAHKSMGAKYATALEHFAASSGLDSKGADEIVKGQDRAPTELIDGLVARLKAVVDERRTAEQATVQRHIVITAIVLAIVFAALVGVSVYGVRAIVKPLERVTEALDLGATQTTSAAAQVASSAQTLSQGATEQAASLEETSASLEEMSAMTRRNADNSRSAATLMSDAQTRATTTRATLDQMVSSMHAIVDSSREVARIIKTVDEIAFQTNILALNAAVEAARAGEAGMGFAVVADEVRALAQRAAGAASETAALIETSSERAKAATATVSEVTEAFAGVTASITELRGLVDEVNEASRQQADGIGQVTQAVGQMERVTQTTAATAEESAAASEELSAQAETTMGIVAELRTLLHGGASASPAAPAQAAPALRRAA
jgi:methyl-accepting chemotaxis protein